MRRSVRPGVALAGLLVAGAAAAGPPSGSSPANSTWRPTHRVGFSRRAITPGLGARPVYLAGFDLGRRATGIHDELWARAVALADREGGHRVVLVAVDLSGLFNEDVRKVRALLESRAPGVALVVASTHDHEGPDTLGLWGSGRFSSGVDKTYLERVRAAITDAALEALSRRQPAQLVLARARTPGLIEDGRLPIVIDDTLLALRFVGERGGTLVTLVAWSSHPEALGGRNTLLSSDYPHYLRGRIEERLGGSCVFVVGAIGGLMTPIGLKLQAPDGHAIPADSFELAQAVGERAAEAALAALRDAPHASMSDALDYRSQAVFLPLENRLFRLAILLGVIERPLFSRGRPASALFGDDLRTEIGHLRVGDAEALLVPGEIYPELVLGGIQDPQDPAADYPGAPRERPLYGLLRADYKLVVGLANDEIGYVIPRSQWDERRPFAYGRRQAQYGEVNSIGPSSAQRLEEAFERLIGR